MLEQCCWWNVVCHLAKVTGSQSVEEKAVTVEDGVAAEKERLLNQSDSASK